METKRDSSPLKVGLFDGNFLGHASMSYMADDEDRKPRCIEWCKGELLPLTFYTDTKLHLASKRKGGRNAALLIEAPPFRTAHYKYAKYNQDDFDYIFTYCKELVDGKKWLWYPRGGSRIRKWGIREKTKMVSFLASFKLGATGHLFRHDVYKRFGNRLFDVYGSILGGQPTPKLEALADYRYTVVIPAERQDGLFSDHIIDPMSVGTVPIYWRRYDIGDYFDLDGILTFDTLDELEAILTEDLSKDDYESRSPAIEDNLRIALLYCCAEDWIYENYPEVFHG